MSPLAGAAAAKVSRTLMPCPPAAARACTQVINTDGSETGETSYDSSDSSGSSATDDDGREWCGV